MAFSVMWFRRDLRLGDNPALLAAAADGAVLPLFVLDPVLFDSAGPPRRAYLLRSLRALSDALDGSLVIRCGDPVKQVADVARGASGVHIAADYGPYGSRRDAAVESALPVPLHRTGSPYAVAPGRIRKPDGTPYRVFTPFLKAWTAHGWRRPVEPPREVEYVRADGHPLPEADPGPLAGERAALDRWATFRHDGLDDYETDRDRGTTSRLSAHLKYGEIHPRTLLAGLGPQHAKFRAELCWREFYADVLHHRPQSIWEPLDPATGAIETDSGPDADRAFGAWATGRTGYPLVDAGMRQLLAEGWMPNRVRMITASFLVKDLHLPWQRGAAHFLHHLVDGDLASNNHGWQWVAGTGTDAAPYVRVFNPVLQARKFDPDGAYARRWIPELRDVADVHDLAALPPAYPRPIVDHDMERRESLRRFEVARATYRPG